MRLLTVIVIFFLIQSCSQEPKIVITKDYISNKYWDEYNNAIYIERMKVKKGGVLDIFSPDFEKEIRSNWELNDKLEVDSTFMYSYSGVSGISSDFDLQTMKESLKKNKSELIEKGLDVDSLINSIKIDTTSRKKLEGKIYFNKTNGFYWNFGYTYYGFKKTNKSVIGSLKNGTWYKFSNLKTIPYYVYVYVDDTIRVRYIDLTWICLIIRETSLSYYFKEKYIKYSSFRSLGCKNLGLFWTS